MMNNLEFGIDKSGQLIHVDEVKSGLTYLQCPFCNQSLIAKKGQIVSHHFAHSKNTCKKAVEAVKKTQIPLFNTFNVLDCYELKYIERKLKYKEVYSFRGMKEAIERLETMSIISCEYDEENWIKETREALRLLDPKFIDKNDDISISVKQLLFALKPAFEHFTNATISKLDDFSLLTHKQLLNTKIDEKLSKYLLDFNDLQNYKLELLLDAQKYWLDANYKKIAIHYQEYLDLYVAKVMLLANQNLYVIHFIIINDGKIHNLYKFGMTSRDCESRLFEIKKQLNLICKVQKASIVHVYENLGRIERLLHRCLSNSRYKLSSFTEFYCADAAAVEKVIDELEKLKSFEQYKLPTLLSAKTDHVI